jgi:uncharacterized protein YkwD
LARVGEIVRLSGTRLLLATATGALIVWLPASSLGAGPGAPTRTARSASACPGAGTPSRRLSTENIRGAILCLIGQQRAAAHLPRLRESRQLDAAAQRWANAMVSSDQFGHGADLGARISSTGFRWSNAAEDIATGVPTPRAAVRIWMRSAGHCQNILSPQFAFVGIGVNRHGVAGYTRRPATWTLDFALPMGMRQPSGNWAPANSCPH